MDVRIGRQDGSCFLWDAERLARPRDHHFDPGWWRAQGRLAGGARGRGTSAFVDTQDEGWVLRHYRRGGAVRRISLDHYFWFGMERTRAFAEWRLLAELARLGLPAPAPVAARVVRSGPTYRADLLTARIRNARTLAERLAEAPLAAERWRALGRLLARFHAAGVCHADLNAHNVLLDEAGRFTLIDFDHSRIRRRGRWRQKNLARLRRSLDKLAGQRAVFHFAEADWAALREGYAGDR